MVLEHQSCLFKQYRYKDEVEEQHAAPYLQSLSRFEKKNFERTTKPANVAEPVLVHKIKDTWIFSLNGIHC